MTRCIQPQAGRSIHAIGFRVIGRIIETISLLDVGEVKISDTVSEGGKSGVTVPGESITQAIKIANDTIRNHGGNFKDRGWLVPVKIIPSGPKVKG